MPKRNGICVKPLSHSANSKNVISKSKTTVKRSSGDATKASSLLYVFNRAFKCGFGSQVMGNAFDVLRLAHQNKDEPKTYKHKLHCKSCT